MRRFLALLSACALVASVAVSSVTAAPARNGFVGAFELRAGDTGVLLGRVGAVLWEPTATRLVPGTYDFWGAPGNWIRESHAQLGLVDFYFDPLHEGGSNVAFAEGVECIYIAPNDSTCGPFAVMFIDPLDPARPNQVAFANSKVDGNWDFVFWHVAGRGIFALKYFGG